MRHATHGLWRAGPRAGGGVRAIVCLGACVVLAACSASRRKLSPQDAGVVDTIVYDVFGVDRNPTYYFELVRESHDRERFAYRPSDDPYLIDKNVDAVQRLGQAEYARLEGQAQVVGLLTDVMLEDPSALAQANAANSLTRLGVKLPQYPSRGTEERGDRFLALLQEMDAMHAPGGAMLRDPVRARGRLADILRTIGDFEMRTLVLAKDALKPFYTRAWLVDADDPAVRQAADTALVKRMGEVIRLGLRAALDASVPYVREEAVRGLKTLGDRAAEDAVLARLAVETNWRVRAEMVEYLGRSGSAQAIRALLPLLEAPDPTIRHKTRQALTRVAGRDLGFRRRTWRRWAEARHPELIEREEEPDVDAGDRAPGR